MYYFEQVRNVYILTNPPYTINKFYTYYLYIVQIKSYVQLSNEASN